MEGSCTATTKFVEWPKDEKQEVWLVMCGTVKWVRMQSEDVVGDCCIRVGEP